MLRVRAPHAAAVKHLLLQMKNFTSSFFLPEFTQGMILPTANGVAKLPSSSQSKAKLDKTQVGPRHQALLCLIDSSTNETVQSVYSFKTIF